jgi:hypothetical protein
MKPFNLEEALAGKPVVTRDGREVTQLHRFSGGYKYTLVGIVDNVSINDLFMASTKRTGYINIFSRNRPNTKNYTSYIFDTLQEAQDAAEEYSAAAVGVVIEWEE